MQISKHVLWKIVDVLIIDGLVNLVAKVCSLVGAGVRKIQTGYIPDYAWLIMAGVAVVCGLKILF